MSKKSGSVIDSLRQRQLSDVSVVLTSSSISNLLISSVQLFKFSSSIYGRHESKNGWEYKEELMKRRNSLRRTNSHNRPAAQTKRVACATLWRCEGHDEQVGSKREAGPVRWSHFCDQKRRRNAKVSPTNEYSDFNAIMFCLSRVFISSFNVTHFFLSQLAKKSLSTIFCLNAHTAVPQWIVYSAACRRARRHWSLNRSLPQVFPRSATEFTWILGSKGSSPSISIDLNCFVELAGAGLSASRLLNHASRAKWEIN